MANSKDVYHFEVIGNNRLFGLLSSLKDMLMFRHLDPRVINKLHNRLNSDRAQESPKMLNVEYSQVIKMLDDALQEQWPHDDFAQPQEINLPTNLQIGALSGSKRLRSMYFATHNLQLVHSELDQDRLSNSKR
jgi:hypothetical protein